MSASRQAAYLCVYPKRQGKSAQPLDAARRKAKRGLSELERWAYVDDSDSKLIRWRKESREHIAVVCTYVSHLVQQADQDSI